MKFFSFRLYKEAMRQSRAVGIVSVLVATLISAFVPVIMYFEHKEYNMAYMEFINVENLVTGIGFVSVIIPIIIAVKIFGFLFKRSSSDFYHALPYTRQCLYVTNLVAVLTWCVLALVLMVAVSCGVYGLDPHSSYEPEFAFYNLLVGLVIMLVTSGAVMIAVSITGKPLLAMEIAAFVVFLPRVIILIALASVESMTLMIDINQVPILSINYSLPLIMTLGSTLSYSLYIAAFSYVPGIVYSLVLAIIYLIIGCVLFCKRRSETAENAAPNRKVQIILRIVYSIGFFFNAVGIYMEYGFDESVITLIVIGLLVYYGYELITTKKLKKMFKATPGLVFVVILCLIYGGLINLAADNILDDVPTADEIESVQISEMSSYYWYDDTTYNDILIGQVAFEDKEVMSIITKAYGDTAAKVKEGERIEYDYDLVSETYRINYKNGKSNVRVLYMTYEEYAKLQTLFTNNKDYQDARYAIPEEAYVTEFFNGEYNEAVWKQFREEYEMLSDSDKLKVLGQYDYLAENEIVYDSYYEEYYDEDEYLWVSGYVGTKPYRQEYILSESLTPKTLKLLYEYRYLEQRDSMMRILDKIVKMDTGEINLWTGGSIEVGNYLVNNIDLYIYYDDGEISGGELCGDWLELSDVKSGSNADSMGETATYGDAEYEDDYYYSDDYYYYDSEWYSFSLDANETEKIMTMMLDAFDFDEQKTSSQTPSVYVYASSWTESGISSNYDFAEMYTVVKEAEMEKLIEYMVENYCK